MPVWYCRNCGYEVDRKGRCHQCRAKLVASPLPALEPLGDDAEVGYRLDDWADDARGELIGALVAAGIVHRFEGDELVVALDDESATDDLVDRLGATPDAADEPTAQVDPDDEVATALAKLAAAARRLRVDPTDMEADGEVAEVSSGIFLVDTWAGADDDTWAAIGRVTRRLLAALGSEEALDDDIRRDAGVLATLVAPLLPGHATGNGSTDVPAATVATAPEIEVPSAAGEPHPPAAPEAIDAHGQQVPPSDPVAEEDEEEARRAAAALGLPLVATGTELDDVVVSVAAADEHPVDEHPADEHPADEHPAHEQLADDQRPGVDERLADDEEGGDDEPRVLGGGPETSYEVPDWLPDQRALLTVLLEDAGIAFAWQGADLIVPSSRESEVEALFDRVGGVDDDVDDEARYRAIEELFAAVTRLASDPDDPERGGDVVRSATVMEGPTPLGYDDGQWLALRRRTRTLCDALEQKLHPDVVASQAAGLRDSLRALV